MNDLTLGLAAGADVVVVGAGVIGLAVAWQAALTGAAVTVCDPSPATGASWAAAGMLAPVTEARPGEESLARLGCSSLELWPAFAAKLEAGSGADVGFCRGGTLAVGVDDDDRRALDELAVTHRELGLGSETLSGRAARRLEPLLNPRLRAGLMVPGDHQVDPRALLLALMTAGGNVGVDQRRAAVVEIRRNDQGVSGVTLDGGEVIDASVVVVAAGSLTSRLRFPASVTAPPIRPVKGQILRLRADPDELPVSRTVRALVHGREVYLVPRRSGELVVGATMEEQGFDTTVTAGAVADLLRAAIEVVPDIADLELVETTARLRPATPDNGPILGLGDLPGLIYATGHHRNGVLLTPITVEAVLAVLAGRSLPAVARRFGPERFT